MSVGVLNQAEIGRLIQDGRVKGEWTDVAPDPSAIDLPLGRSYYRMPGSCRSRGRVLNRIRDLRAEQYPLTSDTIFKAGEVYLVEVAWTFDLPEGVCVHATAKSTIGRLDAVARLVADDENEFDRLRAGTKSTPYLEVAPLTFDLRVKPGVSLSQVRFIRGNPQISIIPPEALHYEEPEPLTNGKERAWKPTQDSDDAVLLSLDAGSDCKLGFMGFAAKKRKELPNQPIDLREAEPKTKPDPRDYWDPVRTDEKGYVLIERDRFYIFRSKERFRIPRKMAVECQAYTEGFGDIRIHYAGFAHPFFGTGREPGDIGTPLIFEVRGHSMHTHLRDGDALAKVYFYWMSEDAIEPEKRKRPPAEATAVDEGYNKQELTLSKRFGDWNPA
jgi:dCTP deaminase